MHSDPEIPKSSRSDASGATNRRQFWIDVGGTFTDCLLREVDGAVRACKVLSSGRIKGRVTDVGDDFRSIQTGLDTYPPGFFAGYRASLDAGPGVSGSEFEVMESDSGRLVFSTELPSRVGEGTQIELSAGEPAPVLGIRLLLGLRLKDPVGPAELRLGTTRATNALLERKGVRTAWVTTQGFEDLLLIGNQDRPHLFDLNIQKPSPLFERAAGLIERIDAEGRVVRPLDVASTSAALSELKAAGLQSLAVCLMNAYQNAEHEREVRRLAERLGFEHISLSSEISPTIKMVPRGDTTLVDAYLTPVIREYLDTIARTLPDCDLRVMTSAGVLTPANRVSGKDLVLSGPAGGVVGFARASKIAGMERALSLIHI